MATDSMSIKMVPALIYKNEENEYEIDVYEFCNIRDIEVRDLYPKESNGLAKVLNDEMRSDEFRPKCISSINIQPKSRIVNYTSEIRITDQPAKRVIYKNSIEIARGFKAEKHPFVKVATTNERKSHINWKSSIEFSIEFEI